MDLWLGLLLPSGAEEEELGSVTWSQREWKEHLCRESIMHTEREAGEKESV